VRADNETPGRAGAFRSNESCGGNDGARADDPRIGAIRAPAHPRDCTTADTAVVAVAAGVPAGGRERRAGASARLHDG
jgi:hypothetical protein